MTDVFISYASEDRDRARSLASALEARGWSVWWDRKIVAGQTFDQIIEHELETAKSVVVLWSRNSISSEWVKNEAAAAAERGVLVPALIDSVKLPLEFRRKQTADLIGWDGDLSQESFQALCDGVAAAITGVAPAEPPTLPSRRLGWNRRWALGVISVIAMNIKSLVTRVWALLRKEPLASIALLISLASLILTLLTNAAVWASSDIRDLIAEEAKVSVTGDVEKAVSLYTEDALIRDWGDWDANAKTHPVQSWQGVRDIRERYKTLPRYSRLLHVDVNIEELQLLEGAARAKSSTDGIMLWDGKTPTIVASIDGDIWEFKKVNRHPFIPWSGEWKISSFTYNNMPREH